MASPSSLSATDRVSLSVSFLTQQCVDKFNRQPTKDGPSLENRLADFNLWADGVGALAKPGLSLDSRFRDRPDDLRLVKAILIMLADFLDEYGGSDDHPEEHLRNVDSSIKNLAMLGVAIRRTGRASRNRKADRTFDPGEHQELKRHLECIILLRPVEDTPQSVALDLSAVDTFRPDDSERHELIASELNKLAASRIDGLGESKLSDIQKRVVEANLRRRHRFLLAQKRHRETIFGNSQRGPEAAVSEQGLSAEEAPRAPLRGGLAASPRVGASRGKGQLAPTVAGLSTASTAEGTLRYNPLPRRATTVAKTQITSIAADAEFPRPPPPSPDRRISKCPCCCQSLLSEVFKEPSQWRQHLIEDLRPYTCVAAACPTPYHLFATRKEWETHVENDHACSRWQCPFCDEEENQIFPTMEGIASHIQADHQDELSGNSLSAMVSWSSVQRMGIKTCPLCSSCGEEDAPDLVDHVLRHTYDFSLRALPWPQPPQDNLNKPVGTYTLPDGMDSAERLEVWIENISPDTPTHLQLSRFDTAIHAKSRSHESSPDACYFAEHSYFEDKSVDDSSKPQRSIRSVNAQDDLDGPILLRVDFESGGRMLEGHESKVYSVAFSTDSQLLASSSKDYTIMIWDVVSGNPLRALTGHTGEVNSVQFSPGSQHLASGSDDKIIRIWDVATGQCLQTLNGHTRIVLSVVFSPDSQHLASGSLDSTVRIWDMATGQCLQICNGHLDFTRSVVFSPDGQNVASGSDDKTIRIWDMATGQCLQNFEGHTDYVKSVMFSPDGQNMASGSDDRTIRIWDMATGQCLQIFEGHTDNIQSIVFSAGGQNLASGGTDKTIRIWDVAAGQCLQTWEGHNTGVVPSVAFSPDGQHLAASFDDGTIRIWNVV